MKAINDHTTNEFQEWQSKLYKSGIRFCDIDAWVILLTKPPDYRPIALLELKRSHMSVESWWPFNDDRAQYVSLLELARAAKIPLIIVYFRKGETIEDETQFQIHRLDSATPEYHGVCKLITSRAFRERFPNRLFMPGSPQVSEYR